MPDEPQEQHLFLKCLLEANVDGIIAFDREFRYTTWNRAMERISGVKREDVLGKCALEIFPCLQETGEKEFYLEALAGRSVVAENRPFTPPTGKHGYFDGYYSPRHDENGEVIGGVAIIRDVTDRKVAEASALDDHKRLAFHVENTPLAVIEWNHEFRVLRWSPAAQRLFGCFLFLFSLEIKNGDGNAFGWIFENIFSENIFSNEPKIGNNKISFSVFLVEIKNLIMDKMKTR